MKYIYNCEICGEVESEEKAFKPRKEIKCECGRFASKVFKPNRNIINNMSNKTK